jgi:hypothetical protein
MTKLTTGKKYGFLWVTLAFFIVSFSGHWIFSWYAYIEEQESHNQPVEFSSYIIETTRDTLENWQSEFLQLIWQVAGLAFLWHVGSSQSKEGDERKEEKLDEIIKHLMHGKGEKVISDLEKKYPKK